MFWKWLFHRRSVFEILQPLEKLLPLKNFKSHRLPTSTVIGDYFGFHLVLEGRRKGEGYRFFATVELPRLLQQRIFLSHERRKTSFKPIASLKLVTTLNAHLNQSFLLLASDEEKAKAVFQPYLCGKIMALENHDWLLDVHGNAAHLELWQARLNASQLSNVLKTVAECLNALLTAEIFSLNSN